jgi:hypothetical protein
MIYIQYSLIPDFVPHRKFSPIPSLHLQVLKDLERGFSQRELAKRYYLSQGRISQIKQMYS